MSESVNQSQDDKCRKIKAMPQTETTAIHFLNNDGSKSSDATLHTIHYDQKDCFTRALMRLGLFWLLAFVSVFLIIAHWVLVPGFFIAGPIVAVMTYKTKQAVEKCTGPCPSCSEQITIKMEAKDTLPKWTYCPSCSSPLHIDE
jgi:hypothetical protein